MTNAPPALLTYTIAAFEAWAFQPEQANQRFELIDGEMIEVPSNVYSSWLALKIMTEIMIYL
ncbi:MAG: hypothetical protein H7Y11_14915, partial [Armatimonadetes bacterium]|nr:hypothetical protein [Anaerolineae bacterium]